MPRKLNADANASMKILGLFCLLLFSGKKYSLGELAIRLRCSKQTILRLIDQISTTYDIPLQVRSERQGRENWYWATCDRRPLNVVLKPESIQQLLLCKDLVCHLIPRKFRDDITQAIEQAGGLLTNFGEREKVLTSYAAGVPKGQIDYSGQQDTIKALFKAIERQKVCQALYHAPKYQKPKKYQFVPLKIVAYRDALYLRCRSYPEGEDKTFAIHRFKSLEVLEKVSDLKPAKEAQGEKVFGFVTGKPFALSVEFFPPVAGYVAERTWCEGQQVKTRRNGNVVLTFRATNQTEVLAWILSFGRHARILSPETLKAEYLEQINEIKKAYGRRGQ